VVFSVVIRLVFELELRFCNMRGMLKCRIQTTTWSVCFGLRRGLGGTVSMPSGGDFGVHTPVSTAFGLVKIMGVLLCP